MAKDIECQVSYNKQKNGHSYVFYNHNNEAMVARKQITFKAK
jgi:hypothetical protein